VNSEERLRALSARYGINQKTVAKWRKRTSVADHPTGPDDAKSTVPTFDEEAIIVAFRRHTLLPLDDCVQALQPTVPHLSRSSLHRRLQRHDISRLPEVEGDKGVFTRMTEGLAFEADVPKTVMIDATHRKAHRMAIRLRSKKGGSLTSAGV